VRVCVFFFFLIPWPKKKRHCRGCHQGCEMSPPRVGSQMQDYDHWDALVIGEWPPGPSGPRAAHTKLFPFHRSISTVRYSFRFPIMSCHVLAICVDQVPVFILEKESV
jgi:hypothetical protein